VNGDGRDDIVGFGSAGVYVSVSTGIGFTSPALWVSGFGTNAGWLVGRNPRVLADVNGDGRDDIVGFGDAGVGVSLSTGSGFTSPQLWVASYGYNQGYRVGRNPRILADVNGDGRSDVVGFGDAGVAVSLSTGNGFTTPQIWVNSYGFNQGFQDDNYPRFVVDVNGDALADVVAFGQSSVAVSLSTGTSFAAPQTWVSEYGVNSGWRAYRNPRLLADVNGDGLADVVGFGDYGVSISLSTGSSFAEPRLWIDNFGYVAGGWRYTNHPRMLADVNDDGMADVIGFGDAGVYVSLSTGLNFSSPDLRINEFGRVAGGWSRSANPRMLADVDGDDRADVVGFANEAVAVALSRLR